MTPTAASSRASRLTYERYLDFLAKAKIAAGLPALGAVEENLLADILRFTSTGQHLGVVAAMSLNAQKTTITNFSGVVKGGDLLLVGKCAECHSDVARVIEAP